MFSWQYTTKEGLWQAFDWKVICWTNQNLCTNDKSARFRYKLNCYLGKYSAASKIVNSIEDWLIIRNYYEKKWEVDAFLCWKLKKNKNVNQIEDWLTQIFDIKLWITGISIEKKSVTIEQTVAKKQKDNTLKM